ncbi:MAG: hypothetical protein NT163_09875 [Chlorobiales bacterium]|nr:hypothetical protein [Chlorobiales bacterium]
MKSLPKKQQQKAVELPTAMPLEAINYIMIALGALVIAGSYGIMFLEKEVDGFFALYVCPITLIAAYGWIVFAVLYRPKKNNS